MEMWGAQSFHMETCTVRGPPEHGLNNLAAGLWVSGPRSWGSCVGRGGAWRAGALHLPAAEAHRRAKAPLGNPYSGLVVRDPSRRPRQN